MSTPSAARSVTTRPASTSRRSTRHLICESFSPLLVLLSPKRTKAATPSTKVFTPHASSSSSSTFVNSLNFDAVPTATAKTCGVTFRTSLIFTLTAIVLSVAFRTNNSSFSTQQRKGTHLFSSSSVVAPSTSLSPSSSSLSFDHVQSSNVESFAPALEAARATVVAAIAMSSTASTLLAPIKAMSSTVPKAATISALAPIKAMSSTVPKAATISTVASIVPVIVASSTTASFFTVQVGSDTLTLTIASKTTLPLTKPINALVIATATATRTAIKLSSSSSKSNTASRSSLKESSAASRNSLKENVASPANIVVPLGVIVAPRPASSDRLIYISVASVALHATHARLCVVVAPSASGPANAGEITSANRCLTVSATARLAEAQRASSVGDMLAAFSLSNALSGALNVTATVLGKNGQLIKTVVALPELVSSDFGVVALPRTKSKKLVPSLQALWV